MRQIFFCVIMGSVFLAGCATQKDDANAMTNAQLQAALETQQQEWDNIKPQLERVLALESDLKLLVETLEPVPESTESLTQTVAPESEVSGGSDDPDAPVVPMAELAKMNEQSAASTDAKQSNDEDLPDQKQTKIDPFNQVPPKHAVTVDFYGQESKNRDLPYFGVQIAAYASEQLAREGWRKVSRAYPEEFVDTAPLINRSEIKGKTYYQLIVGPFLKKPYGDDFCNMLKQMQQDCLVTRYKGEPFLSL